LDVGGRLDKLHLMEDFELHPPDMAPVRTIGSGWFVLLPEPQFDGSLRRHDMDRPLAFVLPEPDFGRKIVGDRSAHGATLPFSLKAL
jgi:hypothetical protein